MQRFALCLKLCADRFFYTGKILSDHPDQLFWKKFIFLNFRYLIFFGT